MKNISFIITFTSMLLQVNLTNACTCDLKSFCESTTSNSTVVQVEVIDKYSDSSNLSEDAYADIRIIETLQNGILDDTLTISGLLLSSCNEPLPGLNIGDTLLFNFIDPVPSYQEAKYPTIQLYSCETRIVKYTGGLVTGFIQPNVSSISYSEFVATLGECIDLISSIVSLNHLFNEITITPNPFSQSINIHLSKQLDSKINIELFSVQGKRVLSESILESNNPLLDLSSLEHGVYFLKIYYRNTFVVKRIVKV